MLIAVNPCRFRIVNGRRMGTVPVGTIVYLQDCLRPLSGFRGPIIRRNPWQVVAFAPQPSSFDGMTRSTYGSRAVVKSLRDGRTQTIGEWQLLAHDDAYLTVS